MLDWVAAGEPVEVLSAQPRADICRAAAGSGRLQHQFLRGQRDEDGALFGAFGFEQAPMQQLQPPVEMFGDGGAGFRRNRRCSHR